MPGGLLTVTFERCRPFMEKKKMKIEKLGNQSALSLNYKGKRLEIINIYRIPATSSYGPCCSVTQYVRAEGKIKSPAMYRKDIFDDIKRHISNENITDVIIAGDYNQGINERAVQ